LKGRPGPRTSPVPALTARAASGNLRHSGGFT
jgi:hypothetical protein